MFSNCALCFNLLWIIQDVIEMIHASKCVIFSYQPAFKNWKEFKGNWRSKTERRKTSLRRSSWDKQLLKYGVNKYQSILINLLSFLYQ